MCISCIHISSTIDVELLRRLWVTKKFDMLWDHKAPRHLVHVVAVVVSWLLTTHWHERHDAVAIHTAQAFRLALLHCLPRPREAGLGLYPDQPCAAL